MIFKVKKIYIILFTSIIALAAVSVGFYIYTKYNPDISVRVGDSSAGEYLKVQAPHVSVSVNYGIEPASYVELKINTIWIQHELVCRDLMEKYKVSDIKLDMKEGSNKTILRYYGTATTLSGEEETYEKEVILNFLLNAEISK